MSILDYFKPVETWSAEQVREFLQQHTADEYSLLDVRQPGEYEEGHLPGAQLIPVKELEDQRQRLDSEKTTITYCAAGVRSRAGAAILSRAGFRQVISMSGGIHAWQGLIAEGEPELGATWFAPGQTVTEQLALAWLLEDGARQFYAELAAERTDPQEAELFRRLGAVEEQHQTTLRNLLRELAGMEEPPAKILEEKSSPTVLEGGITLDQARQWVQGKDLRRILELAMGLETNAWDRYLIMHQSAEQATSREAFGRLAEEEKHHLELLSDELDRLLATG